MILHHTDTGQGKTILLLHGMASSTRYWDNLIPDLSVHNRVIAVDLLGFGQSPKPKNVTYNVQTHLNSILDTLDHLGVDYPVILVGHSMGSLLALKFASLYPDKVSNLVLLSLPLYTSAEEFKKSVTKGTKIRELAYYGKTSHILCTTYCHFLGPISQHIAPLYLNHLPKTVARDSVRHTWQAYAQSMEHIITNQNVQHDLDTLTIPVKLFFGTREDPVVLKNIATLKLQKPNCAVKIIEGGHNVGVYKNPDIVEAILN